jgi:hypothetical protein
MLKNKIALSLFTLFLLTASVFSQDKFVVPTQKITGAEEAFPNNEMIVLKITPITDKPKYLVDVKYTWVVLADGKEKKNVLTWPDNTTVGFGRGSAKTIQVFTMINYLYTVREKDSSDGAIVEVGQKNSGLVVTPIKFKDDVVPDPDNPNPPNPNPNPTPGPVLPDGKFGLAKTSYDLVNSKVPAVSRVKGSTALSTSLEGVAASIAAGALTSPDVILSTVKTSNNTALQNSGVSIADWDEFGNGMQAALLKLYKDKKLNVATDYAEAFKEISTGLKAVK